MTSAQPPLIGVDGCRAGWIAVTRAPQKPPEAQVFQSFAALLGFAGENAIIAVDMPIGLPDFITEDGRGPEKAVRGLLGKRKSSVFSIPSRAAVYAELLNSLPMAEKLAAHQRACAVAKNSSLPSKGVQIQTFCIFPKIREIDALITPQIQKRVREVHPEVGFWRLNGEREMLYSKRTPQGVLERRGLLEKQGLLRDFMAIRPPRGAAIDDLLDACACLLIAERIAGGTAQSFPEFPGRDSKGLQMAIWA